MADLSIVKSEPLPLTIVKSEPEGKSRSFADSVKDAGNAFWEWTGKPVADAIGLSGGTEAERSAKAKAAQDAIVSNIAKEPSRVRQEFTNALDSFVAGNPRATLHHALNAIPIVGAGINQTAQDFNEGNYARGIGHLLALESPAAAREIPAAAEAVSSATEPIRNVAGGFTSGAKASLATATPHPVLRNVGRAIGYGVGRASTGNFEGGLAGGYIGGKLAESAPAVPAALRAGVARAQAIAQGEFGPPRVSLADQQGVVLQPSPRVVPQFVPQQGPMGMDIEGNMVPGPFPSGRIPGTGQPAPVIPSATRPAPAWQTIPDAPLPAANEPIPTAPPVLPSGRVVPPAGYVPPRPATAPAPPAAAAEGVTAIDILKGMYPKRSRFTPEEIAQGKALAEKVNAQSATQPSATTVPESQSPPLLPETQPEPPNPALTSTEPTNAPTPPTQKPWAEMTKPEMFEALGLPPGATTQQFVERFAEETKKSGTAPQVPAEAGPAAPDPTALAEMAREIPQGMRKEVAKANYRAVKEGNAEQNTASPVYEATNRAVKVQPVVKALMDNGITYSEMTKLTKPEIESYVNQLSKATAAEGSEHPGNVFSGLSIDELLGELRRAENAAKGAQK